MNAIEFHVFVTSNKSYTHIIFGDMDRTACGIPNEPVGTVGCKHPCSEIRQTLDVNGFATWFKSQQDVESEYRFCKKCKKAFIRWYNSTQNKEQS